MNNKRPGDRVWPIFLFPITYALLVVGLIFLNNGNHVIFWMCIFLSLTCDIVSITICIVSSRDDNLFRDAEASRRELQRQVDSLQHENQRLEETNHELTEKVRTFREESNQLAYPKADLVKIRLGSDTYTSLDDYEEESKRKYFTLLLTNEIRLWDVPEWLRMNYQTARTIHNWRFPGVQNDFQGKI